MTMTLDRVEAEPVFGRRDPDARGYFGAYGGRFVPETLVEPVEALERAYFAARADRAFVDELVTVLRQFVGRPTPLYEAARLSEGRRLPRLPQARRPRPHRRAQDQQRHRPGAAGEADGQDARSSPRPAPASTASPRPPPAPCSASSAWSTWAPRTWRARRSTSCACACSAPPCVGVDAGSRTLKDAISEAMRDWVGRPQDT